MAPRGRRLARELSGPERSRTFTPAKHRTCPGHAAAVVEADDGYEVAYLCLDPVGHGHIDQATVAQPPPRRQRRPHRA